jgi:bacterioferritin-associated ferredoxin
MIVCVCNAIREDEVRSAARDGATNPRAVYKALGCQPQCGCCLDYAQEVINDERAKPARAKRASVVVNFPKAA